MGAYGDITCEFCGSIYHEQEPHQCNAVAVANEIIHLRQRVEELEAAYAERGERLKDLYASAGREEREFAMQWFDPKTGEPL